MTRIGLIRLGGLLATIGGIAYVVADASMLAYAYVFGVEPSESLFTSIFALVLPVAIVAVASVAALYVREKEPRGRWVLFAALVSFIGLGMLSYYMLAAVTRLAFPIPEWFLYTGALLAAVGLVALGIVVIIVQRVLPWWCGAAIIAGSPLFAFLGPILGPFAVGIAWALVGFAIFRAGVHQAEQPSRVH